MHNSAAHTVGSEILDTQLNILHFKFTFGINFRIVWYVHIQYSIVQKLRLDLIFVRMSIYENKIHMKNQPYGMCTSTCKCNTYGTDHDNYSICSVSSTYCCDGLGTS